MSSVPLVPELDQSLPVLGSDEGRLSWLASVDQKQIGLMSLATTGLFFVVGGLDALLRRIQLARPNNTVLTPQNYNQPFTLHGNTMIFLVVLPVLIGIGTYLVPLMIGARDMAFPRLNAMSLWLLVFGSLVLYYSFVAGGAPDAGWYAYPPLTEKDYSPNPGLGYYSIGLLITGIGTVASGINLLVTIFTMRAAGLTMRRLPLFVWMTMVSGFLILGALPALNASLVMIFFDRQLNAHFFDVKNGGSAILWQHYFWSFGHPEVYIMVLSSRRGPLVGPNPWDAWTLEWATSSPPPPHNFDLVPPVRGRRPLWDIAHPDRPDQPARPDNGPAAGRGVSGTLVPGRNVDARPG